MICIFEAFMAAFALFLLSTRHLLTIYVWLASIGVILWSYICNEEYNKYVFSIKQSTLAFELISFNLSAILRFVGNYLFQVFIHSFILFDFSFRSLFFIWIELIFSQFIGISCDMFLFCESDVSELNS
jgi:hypothetical protein